MRTEAKNRSKSLHDDAIQSNLTGTIIFLAGFLASGALGFWISFRGIVAPVTGLTTVMARLAKKEFDAEVPGCDRIDEFGVMARSVESLRAEALEMEAQRWIKTHQAAIAEELQSCDSVVALGQIFLSRIAPLINMGQAVLYRFDEDSQTLSLAQGYAFRERKNLDQHIALGQGLVGQCALERSPITLKQPPSDYIKIGSSLAERPPAEIAILPILRAQRLMGVVELAGIHSFSKNHIALLDGLMPTLAMNIEIIERREKTEKLLAQTKIQADQLAEQTEELEAQQREIKATEAWFRGIVESAPEGMLVVAESGTIILANPPVEAMFGYDPGQLVGLPVEVLVPEQIRGRHVGLRRDYMPQGERRQMGGFNRELTGVRKDGSTFSVEVGLSRLPAVDSRGVCVCASVRDVSERKQAEAKLAAAEERSRLVLTSVDDGIVGLDPTGKVTFINPAAPRLLGFEAEEFLDQVMHPMVHHSRPDGSSFPREECSMYLTAVDGEPRTISDEVFWRKDGTSFPVEYRTTPIRKGGHLVGTVVVFRDITERKAIAEALQRANFQADIALELTGSGYWYVDFKDPDYYFQSERAARILGEPFKADGRYHLADEWFSRLLEANPETANAPRNAIWVPSRAVMSSMIRSTPTSARSMGK